MPQDDSNQRLRDEGEVLARNGLRKKRSSARNQLAKRSGSMRMQPQLQLQCIAGRCCWRGSKDGAADLEKDRGLSRADEIRERQKGVGMMMIYYKKPVHKTSS